MVGGGTGGGGSGREVNMQSYYPKRRPLGAVIDERRWKRKGGGRGRPATMPRTVPKAHSRHSAKLPACARMGVRVYVYSYLR